MEKNTENNPESEIPPSDAGPSLISKDNRKLLELLKKSSSANVKLIYVDPQHITATIPA